ncbi:MAG: mechanosensitive ion channel domain-containing protein [Bacteroidota bacterium]
MNILSYEWLSFGSFSLSVQRTLLLIAIWVLAWLVIRLLKRQVRRGKLLGRIQLSPERKKGILRLFRLTIYPVAGLISLQLLGLPLDEVMNYTLFSRADDQDIRMINLLSLVLTIILARIGLNYFHKWFVNLGKTKRIPLDQGRRLAIYQIVKYFIIVLVMMLCLTILKVDLSVLWVGTTGLLVVIGLALQQTFNDFFSGLLILFDGTLEVGDTIFIQSLDLEGKVMEIRLRTTIVETLDSQSIIVPNGKITSTNVVNWSFNDQETRFRLAVGVAYGSNVQLVRKILRSCANSHGLVLKSPEPRVRFTSFGESSLDFELLFWTERPLAFEDILSDLRYKIEAEFRRYDVQIPFPQRDIHIRSDYRHTTVSDAPPENSPEQSKEKQEK